MPTLFEFKRGYCAAHGVFTQAALDLFAPSTTRDVVKAVLSRLGPSHRLNLAQMKIDQADGDLGRASLTCSLLDFSITLKVELERVFAETYVLERVGLAPVLTAMAGASQAIAEVLRGDRPFKTWGADVGVHGLLRDVRPVDFLGGFMSRRPEISGPSLGSNWSFYYGEHEERSSCVIGADLSGWVDGALYFRDSMTWDASKLRIEDVEAKATRGLREGLTAVGLALPESEERI